MGVCIQRRKKQGRGRINLIAGLIRTGSTGQTGRKSRHISLRKEIPMQWRGPDGRQFWGELQSYGEITSKAGRGGKGLGEVCPVSTHFGCCLVRPWAAFSGAVLAPVETARQ